MELQDDPGPRRGDRPLRVPPPHPLTDRFKQILTGLQEHTHLLHDPTLRPGGLAALEAGVAQIMALSPPPSIALRASLHAVQSDIERLRRSRRNEFALSRRLKETLMTAAHLAHFPPAPNRRPEGNSPG